MDSAAELARARADVARRGAELDSLEASAPERPLAEARLKVARAAFEVADAAHERELATDAVVAAAALLDSAEIAVQLAAAAAAASEQSGDGEAADNARTAAAQKERAREERRIKLAERRRERAERQRALEERQRALEERQRALEQRELRERQLRDLGTPSSPPPAPRVLIPSPSQRARSQIQHKLLKRWMPTAQNVAAMVELHSPRDRDDAAVQEWQRLFKWIEKGPPAGAFSRTEFFTSQSDEHRKLEVAMVSQLALYLEKRLRDRRRDSITDSSILWINELSTAKSNRVDLALLSVEDSGVANIRVIVDSVVGSSSMNKEAPIDAYVYEVTSTSLADHRPYHLLGIALGLPQNGSMEASVWAFSGFNDKRQQDQNRSLLFSGSGNCSAGELMARLEAAASARRIRSAIARLPASTLH
ncbi:hypothetical protein DFJ74DRAFT_726271 [Hyaloraphidium curvatum]|nr:hypothetical protein DFJ74DRAFT_726271 [Hyaloraphidium curvatum]